MVEREGDDGVGPTELEVEFGPINEQNVEQLRVLNTSCFPVNYNDNFYKDVVAQKSDELSKFAYVNGFVVGAVCTRVEPLNGDDGKPTGRSRIYIMTLGVLAAYRGRGVGGKLIQSVLDFYDGNKDGGLGGGGGAATTGAGGSASAAGDENDGDRGNNGSSKGGGGSSASSSTSAFAKSMRTVDEITLHVQTNNDDAMNFYINKFGFERGEMVENYYKRIDPPHCYVLYKRLR